MKKHNCITEARKNKIEQVIKKRQKDLRLIINNIHDPHNVSAILRSCDAFGVYKIHLYYTRETFPALGHSSSASARKWVERERHSSGQEMITSFKQQGYQCLGTGFSAKAKPVAQWDFTQPTAIILGNEHRGMDQDLHDMLDGELYIPMQGMVQSLNVSVAAAVILYEAYRQRQQAGMYEHPSFTEDEMQEIFNQWSRR